MSDKDQEFGGMHADELDIFITFLYKSVQGII